MDPSNHHTEALFPVDTTLDGSNNPAWSPDGKRIIYTDAGGWEAPSWLETATLTRDQRGAGPIYSSPNGWSDSFNQGGYSEDMAPSWSPPRRTP